MILIAIYFLIGSVAGMLSGLLGIGGGLLVVPALAYVFSHYSIVPHNLVMHVAAGTSLTVMIATTARSMWAHSKKGVSFWPIYRQFLPGVIVGTICGALLAHLLHSDILRIVFAIFILTVAVSMLLQRKANPKRGLPGRVGMSICGFAIGGKSGLLGVGGGALTIPLLVYCNVSMRVAVVVSIAVGMTVAVIGSVTFLLSGLHASGLPAHSTGYIFWPACFAVALGSVVFAPLGATFSHRLSVEFLKRIFALFLLVVGVHMMLYS